MEPISHIGSRSRDAQGGRVPADPVGRAADDAEHLWYAEATHDLVAPMAIIESAAQTLRHHKDRLTADQADEVLERIERAAARARRLLTDVLDVQRDTLGAMDARLESVDLLAFATDVVQGLEPSARERIQVRGAHVGATLDPRHARRMLENLISNAVKYTPEGSPIVVRVQAGEDAAICSVDDAGPGVAEPHRNVIWGAFERLPNAHEHADGTGLGLHVVALLAKVQGATVAVDDAPEGGASFRVAFRTI